MAKYEAKISSLLLLELFPRIYNINTLYEGMGT